MMSFKALVLASVLASTSAFPAWIPATHLHGAVRSPCPALNSLANHGFLPRDGKNIAVPVLVKACNDGLNVGADICQGAGQRALQSDAAIARGGVNATTFNLNDLDQHNFIEHDVSISREDVYFGDNHSFNATIYATTKASAKGGLHSPETAGPVRAARIADSTANNPDFLFGAAQAGAAWGESALYLSVMGDPATGIANASFVDSFFEHERLPYELGWRPRVAQTNQTTNAAIVAKLQAAAAVSAK